MNSLQLKQTKAVLLTFISLFLLISCGSSRVLPKEERALKTQDEGEISLNGAEKDESQKGSFIEWLAIFIDGKKAGYIKSTRTISTDVITTEIKTVMEMKRAGSTLEIETVSTTTETHDGKPLSFSKSTLGGGMSQIVSGSIGEDGKLHLSVKSAGETRRRVVPLPPGALMTEGQRLETLKHGLKEGTSYKSKYFDPDLVDTLDVSIEVGPKSEIDLLGRVVSGTKIVLEMGLAGTTVPMTMYVDENLNTLKTRIDKMGFLLEMVACSKPYALSKNDPAEIISKTIFSVGRALSKEDRSGRLTYSFQTNNPARSKWFQSSKEQQISTVGNGVDVTVQKSGIPSNSNRPYVGNDQEILHALVSNEWIQSDSKEIVELAQSIIGKTDDGVEAAFKIEGFVASYITKKDFSVGYASALEVVRSRQGDCTEHALLTAALCQAVGIPARVTFGLVYVDRFGEQKHLLGGHAWTQVYLDNAWISLDAALNGFDAGHVAFDSSNGDPAKFFEFMELLGDLELVEVK